MKNLQQLRQQIIGADQLLETPFGDRRLVYADYTASGRGLHFIEDYLLKLQQRYANSHTEDDTTGRETTQLLHQAEQMIKQAVNAGPEGRIVLCGSGATAAIDRMQQIVGVKLPPASRSNLERLLQHYLGDVQAEGFSRYCRDHQPVVFVGPYEHHSNEVSWREGLATVVEVDLTEQGEIDIDHLEQLLQQPEYQNRLRIGSFSAASNVTGMITDVHRIAGLLHRHEALAFFDYAASAPYVEINMNPVSAHGEDRSLDAVFISPHKFVGGPGSSGILVFNQRCYHSELSPSVAGGGTVDYVGPQNHDFVGNIEVRENAGTPPILQTLKAAMAFELKQAVGVSRIEAREQQLLRRAFERWSKHPTIEILGNPLPEKRIGIVSFNISTDDGQYLHPRFVTTLLDDLFGIQSRAGCSCAGPYGHSLLGIDNQQAEAYRSVIADGVCGVKPGWCRVGFHYLFDDLEADYLIDAVVFIAERGADFLSCYRFDPSTGLWQHSDRVQQRPDLSLWDALRGEHVPAQPINDEVRRKHYQDNLAFARKEADRLVQQSPVTPTRLEGEAGDLQFFKLVSESLFNPSKPPV